MQHARLRQLLSKQYERGVYTSTSVCDPSPCFRLISLAQQHQQCVVHTVWSQEKKWDPGFHEQIDPPPPPPTYLWWCISGISCSLSEWADWIGVFPLHDPFHTGGTNGAKKSFHFLVAHISLNVFTDCNFLLRCAAEIYQPIILGWGQGPPLSALHYQKGLCGLINIDRRLPWRWTKCDVRSVISDTGQFLSVVMNDSVPPPTW